MKKFIISSIILIIFMVIIFNFTNGVKPIPQQWDTEELRQVSPLYSSTVSYKGSDWIFFYEEGALDCTVFSEELSTFTVDGKEDNSSKKKAIKITKDPIAFATEGEKMLYVFYTTGKELKYAYCEDGEDSWETRSLIGFPDSIIGDAGEIQDFYVIEDNGRIDLFCSLKPYYSEGTELLHIYTVGGYWKKEKCLKEDDEIQNISAVESGGLYHVVYRNKDGIVKYVNSKSWEECQRISEGSKHAEVYSQKGKVYISYAEGNTLNCSLAGEDWTNTVYQAPAEIEDFDLISSKDILRCVLSCKDEKIYYLDSIGENKKGEFVSMGDRPYFSEVQDIFYSLENKLFKASKPQ